MAKDEIRECWRCGGKAKIKKISERVFQVQCTNAGCFAQGASSLNRNRAVAWWNKRSDDADEKTVGGND